MFIFTGFYSFTFTPLTSLYPSEILPFRLRSMGVTFYNLANGSFGLMASFVLPFAMKGIGWKFYIVNGCYDIIFVPLIYFVEVETKGVKIDDIDNIFNRKIEDIESDEHSSVDAEMEIVNITPKK